TLFSYIRHCDMLDLQAAQRLSGRGTFPEHNLPLRSRTATLGRIPNSHVNSRPSCIVIGANWAGNYGSRSSAGTAASATTSGAAAKSAKRGAGSQRESFVPDDHDDLLAGGARSATARRLKMVVAYDGSEFAGFQFQPGKVRTVQGELERCAQRLFHGCSRMVGASRTDGGAHAYGQVVHFDVYGDRDELESDTLYYNSFLPNDVRVIGLSYAEDGFDSHFSSVGKTYLYKLAGGLPDP
ncbi:hypothetical protein Agub_g842, partial [Astrephomene gubernaculifera]